MSSSGEGVCLVKEALDSFLAAVERLHALMLGPGETCNEEGTVELFVVHCSILIQNAVVREQSVWTSNIIKSHIGLNCFPESYNFGNIC